MLGKMHSSEKLSSIEYQNQAMGKVFAEGASIFYFHSLPERLKSKLASLVIDSFTQENETEYSQGPKAVAAGMWTLGFLFKSYETDREAKIFNPNISGWLQAREPEKKWIQINEGKFDECATDIFMDLAAEGDKTLKNPEEVVQFETWYEQIENHFRSLTDPNEHETI